MAALARQHADLPTDCPIIISGMASSSICWRELPYAPLPFAPDGSDMVWQDAGPLSASGRSHRVVLLSGVRSEWEIMRGEEIQVLGLTRWSAALAMANEAVLVLPGTHSKHIHVQGGRIIDFQTYMTGELFDVLSRHSVLRHSVAAPIGEDAASTRLSGPVRPAFQEGVEAARARPLLELLFRVRTRQVLQARDAAENRAFLSGLLLGAEMVGLIGRYPGRTPVVLCSGEILADLYELAFRTLDAGSRLQIVPGAEVERLSSLGQAVMLSRILVVNT